MSHPLVESAQSLAEELLFPAALDVDVAPFVPQAHFDRIAAAGLYGLEAAEIDPVDRHLVVESLASGCMSTAFVWIQHHRALRWILDSADPRIRERWLDSLYSGQAKAGLALGGVRPPVPSLIAQRVSGGWVMDGSVPWVTGWGMIDVLFIGAVAEEDSQVWALIDPRASTGITAQPLSLVAANSSGTVRLMLERHFVPEERVVGLTGNVSPLETDERGRGNGSLALGVARRACRLMGASALDDELNKVRNRLDTADDAKMAAARAAASELAVRAATRLVAHTGSRAVLPTAHAQMLARQAIFTTVFGARPPMRAELLKLLEG